MQKTLLIVFVKNIKLGKVKTRLAKTVGNENAFTIYKALVETTEKATNALQIDKHIYFSDMVIDTKWPNHYKTTQNGNDLGERMLNAFKNGFEKGYEQIVLIGSDLPEISASIIEEAFHKLNQKEVVFGPAEDGGYYLIGLSKLHSSIFENKPWSTNSLLNITLEELKQNNIDVSLIQTLNDIDTFEDLKQYPEFLKLIS